MQDVRCRDAIGKWDFGVGQVWVMILKELLASSVFILSEKADYVSAGDCFSGITDTQSPKYEFRFASTHELSQLEEEKLFLFSGQASQIWRRCPNS